MKLLCGDEIKFVAGMNCYCQHWRARGTCFNVGQDETGAWAHMELNNCYFYCCIFSGPNPGFAWPDDKTLYDCKPPDGYTVPLDAPSVSPLCCTLL
jgi:hypothetical protein